jgi:DNA-binding transcriptional MerR regulator
VPEDGRLRIGELSRRSGVSPELLRAWERRYGLLRPERSTGGLRLYSLDDLERVRSMQRHLASGLAAAEAAALAATEPSSAPTRTPVLEPANARRDLAVAIAAFDEARAQAVLDTLLAVATVDTAIGDVVVPYLHDLGARWERGDSSVAEEHFASGLLRGRMLGLARGWGRGVGPQIVLACAPGEQHDLGLIAFGLVLRARGWRIVYLGADTPVASVAEAARASQPAFAVVSAVTGDRLRAVENELRELSQAHRLCLGGAGAAEAELDLDALRLARGPVEEAETLTALVAPPGAR